ncbi:deoxyribonuclease IV [Candidatus Babeliales bacterium]|nr:deoxyribonuclease IV [Candidatus Babeliales bacterium]
MKKQPNKSILLGAHMSISGGLHKAIERAESINCTTMQIFTKNNKSWLGRKISNEEANQFKQALKKSSLKKIMGHTSYLINIGSANKEVEKKSIAALKHELGRCEQLDIPYLILHPGSHLGAGEDKCIKQICKNLNIVLAHATGKTIILLETMAGQGTNVGYKFEHLRQIYDGCNHKKFLGVCFDTCHVFVAGYDLTSPESYKKTWAKFAKIIGMRKLKAIHLNDSKTELGSRKDRHENIGKGKIPKKTFELIMNDKRLSGIPKVLETPSTDGVTEYKREIKLLRNMIRK